VEFLGKAHSFPAHRKLGLVAAPAIHVHRLRHMPGKMLEQTEIDVGERAVLALGDIDQPLDIPARSACRPQI
jgi:hypothetical protein